MPIRALVVDDHASWRRYAATAVGDSLQASIVGEASDGLQAVDDAVRLRPDLVVLDIGLPSLNGLEVGRRILDALPSSRIVFLTDDPSADVAGAAMALGGYAYVVKSDAACELRPALQRATAGRLFVSGRVLATIRETVDPDCLRDSGRRHEVEVGRSAAGLEETFAQYVGDALGRGSAALFVAERRAHQAVERRLAGAGVDLDAAIRDGRYVARDVEGIIDSILVNGAIDEAKFWNSTSTIVSEMLRTSRGGSPGVAVCGAVAPILWRRGYGDAGVQLEQLWDDMTRRYDVDLLCCYATDDRPFDEGGRVLDAVCAKHSAVHGR